MKGSSGTGPEMAQAEPPEPGGEIPLTAGGGPWVALLIGLVVRVVVVDVVREPQARRQGDDQAGAAAWREVGLRRWRWAC